MSDSTESGAAEAVEAAADLLLELCEQDGCELSVALIDDEAMRMLNRDWRGKDRPTDVLSFPQMDEDYEPVPPLEQRRAGMRLPPEFDGASDGRGDAERGGAGSHDRRNGDGHGEDGRADDDDAAGGFALGDVHLGDIVISVDTARRQAAAGGWTLEEELNRLLLHGLLHLLGYDHERGGEDERRMKDEEKRLSAALIDAGLPCARDGA